MAKLTVSATEFLVRPEMDRSDDGRLQDAPSYSLSGDGGQAQRKYSAGRDRGGACRWGETHRISKRAYSIARPSREWEQEYAAGTGSPPCLQRQLTGVTHITDIGEGQIRLSPLIGALETPRLIELDGPEP